MTKIHSILIFKVVILNSIKFHQFKLPILIITYLKAIVINYVKEVFQYLQVIPSYHKRENFKLMEALRSTKLA